MLDVIQGDDVMLGNLRPSYQLLCIDECGDLYRLRELISTVGKPGEAAKVVAAYRERQANWGKSDVPRV